MDPKKDTKVSGEKKAKKEGKEGGMEKRRKRWQKRDSFSKCCAFSYVIRTPPPPLIFICNIPPPGGDRTPPLPLILLVVRIYFFGPNGKLHMHSRPIRIGHFNAIALFLY